VNEHKPARNHEANFDASALSGSAYLYRIQTPEFSGNAEDASNLSLERRVISPSMK